MDVHYIVTKIFKKGKNWKNCCFETPQRKLNIFFTFVRNSTSVYNNVQVKSIYDFLKVIKILKCALDKKNMTCTVENLKRLSSNINIYDNVFCISYSYKI